jgi:hypothetical protein
MDSERFYPPELAGLKGVDGFSERPGTHGQAAKPR